MLYLTLRALLNGWLHVIARVRIEGRENIPEQGGCILCANHTSWWDAIVVAGLTPRVVRFMAKKELFSKAVIGPVWGWLHAFPVDRGHADIKAIRDSLAILRGGEILGIFPEGTRNHDPNSLAEIHGGAALLSLRAGAPIVPVAIAGRYGLFGTVTVTVGKPFTLVPSGGRFSQDVAEGSKVIGREISALWK